MAAREILVGGLQWLIMGGDAVRLIRAGGVWGGIRMASREWGRFGERGAASSGSLGSLGTPPSQSGDASGSAGGAASKDLARGVQRGEASFGPAESPRRVWEGSASPERRANGAGV